MEVLTGGGGCRASSSLKRVYGTTPWRSRRDNHLRQMRATWLANQRFVTQETVLPIYHKRVQQAYYLQGPRSFEITRRGFTRSWSHGERPGVRRFQRPVEHVGERRRISAALRILWCAFSASTHFEGPAASGPGWSRARIACSSGAGETRIEPV